MGIHGEPGISDTNMNISPSVQATDSVGYHQLMEFISRITETALWGVSGCWLSTS